MPRATLIQTNFTAGEISPKCFGRVDVARYQNAAESLENCIVNIHGGAERRPGTLFIAETKLAALRSRLVPFVFSTTQAYMLEFGHLYMRVYQAGGGQVQSGGVPYEISTPYTQDMVREFDFTQGADTMFIFHKSVMIHTLTRYASDSWVLRQGPFEVLPFDVVGHRFGTSLTLSGTGVGAGTATASGSTFLPADVGRRITYLSGEATITGYTSDTQVGIQITQAFTTAALPAGAWVLQDSPKAALKASDKGPVGKLITLSLQTDDTTPELGEEQAIDGLSHDGASTATVTITGHGYADGANVVISGCSPAGYNGTFSITFVDGNTFTYAVTDPGAATVLGTAQSTTASYTPINGFRAGDSAGKYIRINDGLVRVESIGSASTVSGTVVKELSSALAVAPADAWTLESPVWNGYDGYPRTGTLYEQRLVVGGTESKPQGMWGSESGLPFSFTLGTNDDDAFSFELPTTGQINPIQHLVASSALLLMTYGDEYTMEGGIEKPLTPTNVRAKPRSARGSNTVKPVRVGGETLFVQRSGRKVRALAYDTESAQYAAPDLTVLSEHITESGVVDMAYQQEPKSIVWCVRADGKMAVMTMDRDEGVLAWTPQSTDGYFESVACIPGADGDEVWTIVRRSVGGVTKRFVERFDPDMRVDAGIAGISLPGAAVWSGLGHLEGKQVAVVADGAAKGLHTVSGSEIEIDRDAHAVQIGLPYTNRVKLLRPEMQSGEGSAQGNNMRTFEVSLLFEGTVGGKINGDELTTRQFGSELLDEPPPAATGFDRLGITGWFRGDSPIEITQDEPLPFHLLAVIRKVQVNS